VTREEPAIPACLDENAVAALHEGRMTPDERRLALAHVSACATCREWVGALEAADPVAHDGDADLEPRVESAPTRLLLVAWRVAAVAACVLVALGAVWWSLRGREAKDLEGAARSAGVTLLSAADLRDGPLGLERGGLVVLEPRGAVKDAWPRIAWTRVPGALGARVTVRDADGTLLADVTSEGTTAPWPPNPAPLRFGESYVVRVVVRTDAGEVVGAQTFRILSIAERAEHAREKGRIESAAASTALRALLHAHAAARRELWAEADGWLARAKAHGAPSGPLAELTAYVDRHQGRAGP
jgi:hypothetical protein